MIEITDSDQLDELSDPHLWEVAANTRNTAEIRQGALQRWLFPDETNPDADPDDLGGGRLDELRRRATILEPDEIDEDNAEDVDSSAPYFDTQGRLILEHDGVFYLIDGSDDEGSYDGINDRYEEATTDDKTNTDIDL